VFFSGTYSADPRHTRGVVLDDPAVVEDDDAVAVDDCVEPVGDGDRRAGPELLPGEEGESGMRGEGLACE